MKKTIKNGLGMWSLLLLSPLAAFSQELSSEKPSTGSPASVKAPLITTSRILVPLSISTALILKKVENSVPRTQSGSKGLRNFGPAADNSLSYSFNRSDISMSGHGGALKAAGEVKGTVRVQGRIKPVRGTAGKLLGKVNPRVPYSQSLNLTGKISAKISPRILPNWRIQPNLSGAVTLTEARARIANAFDLSLRGEIQPDVNNKVAQEITRLNQQIANDTTLENEARKQWVRLCEPIPIGNEDAQFYLHVTPIGFLASQPVIDSNNISISLGLDAKLQLSDKTRLDAQCPEFNSTLRILESVQSQTSLSINGNVSYEALNNLLDRELGKELIDETTNIMVLPEEIEIANHGDKLLLTVQAEFVQDGWFWDTKTKGTIYLEAKPVLDAESQKIRFENVKLSINSKEALGKVFSTLVTAFSSLIENEVTKISIDLVPEIDKAKAKVASLKDKLQDDQNNPIAVQEMKLDDLTLAGIWHDSKAIYVSINASGTMSAEILQIE